MITKRLNKRRWKPFNVRIVVTPLSQISSPPAKSKSKDAFTGSVTVFQLRHRPVRSLTLQVHIKLLEIMRVFVWRKIRDFKVFICKETALEVRVKVIPSVCPLPAWILSPCTCNPLLSWRAFKVLVNVERRCIGIKIILVLI